MSRCRSCGGEIVWARTVNDRPIPLDVAPNDAGNVHVRGGVAHVLGPLDVAALDMTARAELRMPHHATCPNAAEHRGPSTSRT